MPFRSETQPGEFPECVAVGSRFADGSIVWGASGVLICPNLVLTAHHVLRMNPNVVAIDTISVRSACRLVTVVRHEWPRWTHLLPEPSLNDIAALVLEHEVRDVHPARLPDRLGPLKAGVAVEIVGFGRKDRNKESGFGTQTKGVITVAEIYDGEFAAGGPGEADTGAGDSGGPVYSVSGSERTLVGITSRAVATEDLSTGGVYTSVSGYLPFIQSIAPALLVPLKSKY